MTAEKRPRYYLEIVKTDKSTKKNQFMWREVEKNKNYKDGINVLCFSIGYDSYDIAKKMVKSHNSKRISRMNVYWREKLVYKPRA